MKTVKLNILAGQSNAAKEGMIAALLLASGYGNYETLQYAVNGTPLAADAVLQDWCPSSGELFSNLVTFTLERIQYIINSGFIPEINLIWVQGERDASVLAKANAYEANLLNFFSAFMAAIGQSINLVIVGLASQSYAYTNTVHQAQVNIANQLGAIFIETAGSHYTDGKHYAIDSQNAIAAAIVSHIGQGNTIDYSPFTHNETWVGLSTDDTYSTGAYNDTLGGGIGNDTLYAGYGENKISGGAGNDELSAAYGNDTITGNSGNDTIYGGEDNDNSLLNADASFIANIDKDYLSGSNGNDIIYGSIGDDTLRGDAGSDTLTGGAGNDKFLFIAGDATSLTPDTVTDYAIGDKIVLHGLTYIGSNPFTNGYEVRLTSQGFEADFNGDLIADVTVLTPGASNLEFIL